MIHLCHVDSCPNVVIEGISCGLNVLCTNLGGTPEIVGNNGVILNVDKMWEGKYLPSPKKFPLDTLNRSDVAKGIIKLMRMRTTPDITIFDINKVASKYAKIIRKNI